MAALKIKWPEPHQAPCGACGELIGATNLIERTWYDGIGVNREPRMANVCPRCFYNPDWKAKEAAERLAAKQAPRPRPGYSGGVFEPRALMACTKWKTFAEAEGRADLVSYYLGIRPDIQPRNPGDPGPFYVLGDSPLCPDFDKHKTGNPLA